MSHVLVVRGMLATDMHQMRFQIWLIARNSLPCKCGLFNMVTYSQCVQQLHVILLSCSWVLHMLDDSICTFDIAYDVAVCGAA